MLSQGKPAALVNGLTNTFGAAASDCACEGPTVNFWQFCALSAYC